MKSSQAAGKNPTVELKLNHIMVGWFSTVVAASSTWTILIPITLVLLCCAVDTPYCDAKEKLKDEKSRYIKKAKISIPIPIQFSRDLLIFWHTKIYVLYFKYFKYSFKAQKRSHVTEFLFNWSFFVFLTKSKLQYNIVYLLLTHIHTNDKWQSNNRNTKSTFLIQ